MTIDAGTEGTVPSFPNLKQVWIGMVEVRPRDEGHELLRNARGAFVNIITWASDKDEYRDKVEFLISSMGGMFKSKVENPEPVESRMKRTGNRFEDSIEDVILRARRNPNAILYGTFHTYVKDDG
jgi:hypothetical protein